jgi:hypothetical protein
LYSYRASAVITIFSELVLLVGFDVLLRRTLGPVAWVSLLWKLAAAALVMLAITLLLWQAAPLMALILGAAGYVAALTVLRPFSPTEVTRLRAIVPRLR